MRVIDWAAHHTQQEGAATHDRGEGGISMFLYREGGDHVLHQNIAQVFGVGCATPKWNHSEAGTLCWWFGLRGKEDAKGQPWSCEDIVFFLVMGSGRDEYEIGKDVHQGGGPKYLLILT
jgi:hypothetical protein